jgi:hypothetical protein
MIILCGREILQDLARFPCLWFNIDHVAMLFYRTKKQYHLESFVLSWFTKVLLNSLDMPESQSIEWKLRTILMNETLQSPYKITQLDFNHGIHLISKGNRHGATLKCLFASVSWKLSWKYSEHFKDSIKRRLRLNLHSVSLRTSSLILFAVNSSLLLNSL